MARVRVGVPGRGGLEYLGDGGLSTWEMVGVHGSRRGWSCILSLYRVMVGTGLGFVQDGRGGIELTW